MASDPLWQRKKKWLQTICSIFCWMLTAGSDVFHSWPCEMLSCLCNASYIKYTNWASAACTRRYFWKQMFRSVSPMPFFFYYSMAWDMHDICLYILNVMQKSHVNVSYSSVMKNNFKLSNQLIFLVLLTEYCFYYFYRFIII